MQQQLYFLVDILNWAKHKLKIIMIEYVTEEFELALFGIERVGPQGKLSQCTR